MAQSQNHQVLRVGISQRSAAGVRAGRGRGGGGGGKGQRRRRSQQHFRAPTQKMVPCRLWVVRQSTKYYSDTCV